MFRIMNRALLLLVLCFWAEGFASTGTKYYDRLGCKALVEKGYELPPEHLLFLTAAPSGSSYWMKHRIRLAVEIPKRKNRSHVVLLALVKEGEPERWPLGSTFSNCGDAEWHQFAVDLHSEEWMDFRSRNNDPGIGYEVAYGIPLDMPSVLGWAAIDTRYDSITTSCGCLRD